jgi:hypothetical protein
MGTGWNQTSVRLPADASSTKLASVPIWLTIRALRLPYLSDNIPTTGPATS